MSLTQTFFTELGLYLTVPWKLHGMHLSYENSSIVRNMLPDPPSHVPGIVIHISVNGTIIPSASSRELTFTFDPLPSFIPHLHPAACLGFPSRSSPAFLHFCSHHPDSNAGMPYLHYSVTALPIPTGILSNCSPMKPRKIILSKCKSCSRSRTLPLNTLASHERTPRGSASLTLQHPVSPGSGCAPTTHRTLSQLRAATFSLSLSFHVTGPSSSTESQCKLHLNKVLCSPRHLRGSLDFSVF